LPAATRRFRDVAAGQGKRPLREALSLTRILFACRRPLEKPRERCRAGRRCYFTRHRRLVAPREPNREGRTPRRRVDPHAPSLFSRRSVAGCQRRSFNFGSASSHDAAPVSSGHAVQRTLEVDVATVRVGKSCDQPLHRRVGLDGSLDGVVAAMPSKCQFLLGGLFLCVKRLCRLFSTRNQPRPFQDWQQRL
jgi:hypothetical protein